MTPQVSNVLIVVAAVALAFGGGAGWQFTQARQARQELDATRQDLALVQRERTLVRLEASIALATIAAQFGDFHRE